MTPATPDAALTNGGPAPASEAPASLVRIKACLAELEHLLPAQAPLRDFVHHNTLHAFQHLPFAEACSTAARLTGGRPWLAEERCRELFRQGRINATDIDAALRQLPELRPDEVLCCSKERTLCRGEILQVALRHPSATLSPVQLRWQAEEHALFEALPADLDPAQRQRLLAAAGGVHEQAAVADLWAAACELHAAAVPMAVAAPAGDGLAELGWGRERVEGARPGDDAADASHASALWLWQEMRAGLGERWTLAALLAHLCGEDLRTALQPTLIRHLGAHLDQGLAAWPNPARDQGFYAAWRHSAGNDWAWELDEFADARDDIALLPDDPLLVIDGELSRLDVAPAQRAAYLQRLALELPGWAGMFHWRESHAGSGKAPVALSDLLAVRLLLERLHAEQLLQRLCGLPLRVSELGDYFTAQPAELWVRHARGSGRLPEELLDAVAPLLAGRPTDGVADWQRVWRLFRQPTAATARRRGSPALAAWPLLALAQRLALSGRDLREIGAAGAAALLNCAGSLASAQRGLLWLLAYEHHYRQQILAALAANHGRVPATSGVIEAQFVFCMDDREEGSRRHLEEVNPAFETFGAAGFFGVPMFWQGIDDETPAALCPIVVRPTNTLREDPPAGAEEALRQHRRRRQLRLAWQEKLHQGSRRGWLQASLLTVAAGPAALLALLARTLAPSRFAALIDGRREAFEQPVPGVPGLTAEAAEAARQASAEQPRRGFSEDEQLARVGGFLRSIGLTANFAPLVVIVGHGSDSRNNPHLAAYDCGACSGRHGGPNARVFAALANRPQVRARLAEQGLAIPPTTYFVGAEHNTCDESYLWYDLEQLPASHRQAFAALRADCARAAGLHAVERCRRFASAPRDPSPRQAQRHLADRRQDLAQARPELGHATVASAFIGRRTMSRGAFFDRRVFLISYDPLPDVDGGILEATLLAAGPVGAGINLEYYFSTVDNEGFGCGTKVMHNLAGLFGVMQGASSDLRTGLPLQMIEIHEPMRLLVVVEQTLELLTAIYQRQPPLRELIGNGWVVVVAKHPETGVMHLFDPAAGWQPWNDADADAGAAAPPLPEVERSVDWFAGHRQALPPALLRRPLPGG